MADWIEGQILENTRWTDALFSLKISADIRPFKAGQFVSLALDIEGERVARPYSILSPPGQQPLEFFFYIATDGLLSPELARLNVQDQVWIKQPANGFFVLEEIPDARHLWMLATGTGIAPFMSILGTGEVWQRFEKVILVQAVRTASDLLYQQAIETLKTERRGAFITQPFISREQVEGTIYGRIPAAIENGELENRSGVKLDVAHSQIMLCGNPDMVKDATGALKARGFAKNRRRTPGQITTENYW